MIKLAHSYTDSYIEMASFLKNYYTKSCPIRIIVVSLHSETARVKQVPVPAFHSHFSI